MTTQLRDQQFTCPTCKHAFGANVVETLAHQGQDSDFLPHYVGVNPLPHFLVQCPSCRYSAYPDDYTATEERERRVTVGQIEGILAQPLSKKLPPDARRFYVAARIYEHEKRNPYLIGNLYLRASWCSRVAEDRHAEIEMQQLAARFLREAIDRSVVPPENLAAVTYLVGELYRRLEDRNQAREWFGKVEEAMVDAEEQRWLADLAQGQAELNEHFIN